MSDDNTPEQNMVDDKFHRCIEDPKLAIWSPDDIIELMRRVIKLDEDMANAKRNITQMTTIMEEQTSVMSAMADRLEQGTDKFNALEELILTTSRGIE